MKPDWTYIDSEDDVERFIEGAISDLDTLCPLENPSNNDGNFEQLSCTKFALTMLLEEIRERRNVSPFDILEEFAERMYDYSYEADSPEISHIFEIMSYAAQNVLKEAI